MSPLPDMVAAAASAAVAEVEAEEVMEEIGT